MTLDELIGRLREMSHEYGHDTEVLLAFQPNWPLEFTVGRVVAANLASDPDDPDEAEDIVIYIGQGRSTDRAYVPAAGREELGWSR